jgi:hypothetical protein
MKQNVGFRPWTGQASTLPDARRASIADGQISWECFA